MSFERKVSKEKLMKVEEMVSKAKLMKDDCKVKNIKSSERKVSKINEKPLNEEMITKAKLINYNHKKALKLFLVGFGAAALTASAAVLVNKKLHK